MEMRKETSEVKTDVKLLLECLQYQADNSAATKQALFTLASIFSNYEGAKDHFRSIGGLNYVFTIITSTTNSEVQESAFYCLGCCIENNVFCQKSLTTTSVFVYIHGILSDTQCPTRLKQTATFFLLNLVSNNGQGQTLVRNTGCLSDLLQLLRTSFPKTEVFNRRGTTESWFEDVGMTSVELWSSVASTLCMCVNNPRSDENQSRCGLELGFMFSLIQHCDNPSVLRPLLSLVGFTVASNACTQRQVRQCGGLMVLMARLKVAMDLALCQNSESDSHRAQINLAVTIAGTMDSCILDNVENAEDLSKGDAIPSMLQLLLLESMKQEDKLQVVLTLGHLLELSCESRVQIDAVTGLPDLVKLLTESEDEEFSKAVKYLLQMCIARNEKNSVEAEEESLDAVRRENGKKMLLKIDEISERLKAIEKEAEEKSLGLHQTGQGKETMKKTCCDAVSMTPQEKNLLFQLQQEREDRKRMESLAFQMHAPSPLFPQYGLMSRQCLSEENFPVQGQSFIESDRQRLHRQLLCCTPEILHHQNFNTEHLNMSRNCQEYPRRVQNVGCPVDHGSCVIAPDANTRIPITNHPGTQYNSRNANSLQEINADCETIHHYSEQPSSNTQIKSFPTKINPLKSYLLDHRGDRDRDNHCPESYENKRCSTSNINGLDLNKGQEGVSEIDQMADTTINDKCESSSRITSGKNIASSNLLYPDVGPEGLAQADREVKIHEEPMTVTSTSATDIPKRSTSSDHFTDSPLKISEKTPVKEKGRSSHPQESRTNVSSNVLTNKSQNSCSERNYSTSFTGDNNASCELNSSVAKSCSITKSEKNNVFVKPKPPPMASCYLTPVKRPVNTRMTPSLDSRCWSYSSVRSGPSLYPKSNLEESYPDSDCSSVIDTRSEFDFDLVKAAKKNRLSQNICYNVTPIRRNSLFTKGHQSCRIGIREGPLNIKSTPCSVKSIGTVRARDHKETFNESFSETVSSDEGSLTDGGADAESCGNSTKENLECCDSQKSCEELRVSKCPGD
ncbi:telomere repeats-binding bouquet formation protein 1-like [Pecten maximus]|uniref:telomere repeats-binding bouquet formation protein 1-like n=1 Tax=Pecten maximus TaxID=6579 RepID=UPI001458C808|nr:telomere repeats-binding bouquet formation protein 1-like [Pecten maximus]